ncbi:hypothetical protein [Flavobacterium solisilvae]|uniref:Uncharacterized protein n=1 Tax=Flavobacterium solisilvae TaxID=1852019 RepID=A0ABX1QUN4_9FLAO|nr:hypothetical protein [Flavobacterium solisilvae]NMH25985.1 hypothetical protein [Flavobacterium solisilvae]
MNLKSLISVKFVITIISFFCLIYIIGNITESYRNIEEQNKILLDQKKIYEQILKFEKINSEEKKKLYDIVIATNSKLRLENKTNELSITTNIWIMLGLFLILSNVFTYINSRIDKLKSKESETEKEDFL